MLIANNSQDTNAHTLKLYAIADLLALQNKTNRAIDSLSVAIKKHKGYPIEAYALFKRAQLYTKTKNYNKAVADYLTIFTKLNRDNILADDACFSLALLYQYKLNNTKKSIEYYEKIIFKYPLCIYLVDARNRLPHLPPVLLN